MKIIIDSKEAVFKLAADEIKALLEKKPDASIALAVGESTLGVLEKADLKGAEVFNVCDYLGLSSDDERSLKLRLEKKLGREVHSPKGEDYEAEIAGRGGLDLAILGIGLNGHIGFNEPASPYDSYTREVKLTDSTKRMKAKDFGGEENVPDFAITMGLKTLCSAKKVLLLAFGEEKAQIIHKLVYGKTSTYVPAAMLQMHMDMLLYLDSAAASKLD